MRTAVAPLERLQQTFRKQRVMSLPALQAVVGTTAPMTVFRKLKSLGSLTSYSHRGRYYTLVDIPQFDERGLWGLDGVWFSREGTLVRTIDAWVTRATEGYTADELRTALHVEVKDPLRQLVEAKRLTRQVVTGRYVYTAAAPERRRQQLAHRRQRAAVPAVLSERATTVTVKNAHEVKAAIVLFYSLLDERQRRLYAGLESLKQGHGGDHQLAEWLGLDPHTVAKGRRELLRPVTEQAAASRVRRPGGGRKSVEKKRQP
jgi:hypothetical protein